MRLAHAFGVAALAFSFALPAQAERTLTVLHFNDLHARYGAVSMRGSDCSAVDLAEGGCSGGVARLAKAIQERREEIERDGGRVLLLNGGDLFQGSLFYSRYKGRAGSRLMNELGLDAMTVGNHEFDDGPATLARFIDEAGFPVLGANVDAAPASGLADRLPGFAVFGSGGERVAVIGVVAEDTAELSRPGEHVRFLPVEEVLPPAVAALEADGIDRIVLLSHVGLARDREIAASVRGIDLIVGGHSHTLLSNRSTAAQGPYPVLVEGPDGRSVPIVQAGAHGRHLGEIALLFDGEGRVVRAEGEPIPLGPEREEDERIAHMVAELAGPLQEWKETPVGAAAVPVDGSGASCRLRECAMGNLVADAVMWGTAAFGTEIVIVNGGGLRASFDAGEVTMGEVLEALPFGNAVSTLLLSGRDVLAALENGVSRAGEGAGRFPQVAGLRFAWRAAEPEGERIVSVEVRGPDGAFSPLEPGRRYRVATSDYLRQGGDGYDVLAARAVDPYDHGPAFDELLAGYLAESSPVAPRVEGRITGR